MLQHFHLAKGPIYMLRYEVLILAIPEITQDETKSLETQFSVMVDKAKGSVLSFERWGKYALAYPVAKNNYGVYFLARFEVERESAPLIEQIRHLCAVKFDGIVMRSMVSSLDPKKSLAYHRQHSLEEATTQDVSVGNHEGDGDSYGAREGRSRGRGSRDEGYQNSEHQA